MHVFALDLLFRAIFYTPSPQSKQVRVWAFNHTGLINFYIIYPSHYDKSDFGDRILAIPVVSYRSLTYKYLKNSVKVAIYFSNNLKVHITIFIRIKCSFTAK